MCCSLSAKTLPWPSLLSSSTYFLPRHTRCLWARAHNNENGSVESSHRYLKDQVDQALELRGHRDFADRPAYDEFVRGVVMRRNRRNAAAFQIEREHLLGSA